MIIGRQGRYFIVYIDRNENNLFYAEAKDVSVATSVYEPAEFRATFSDLKIIPIEKPISEYTDEEIMQLLEHTVGE